MTINDLIKSGWKPIKNHGTRSFHKEVNWRGEKPAWAIQLVKYGTYRTIYICRRGGGILSHRDIILRRDTIAI